MVTIMYKVNEKYGSSVVVKQISTQMKILGW